MAEQRMVPVELLARVLEMLSSAHVATKLVWPRHDLCEQISAIIDGPGAELPPQYPKQAKTMLICAGEDVSPAEVGHWFSPEYIAELLATPSAPVARCHECGKLASDGWALYCVECAEKIGPAQAVPDGWQLVPVEPTKEMLLAAWHEGWFSTQELRVHYKVMLSAAPQPPVTAQPSAAARPLVDDPEGRN